LLRQKRDGIVLNAHYDGDGAIMFKHACIGCEGIVTKQLGSGGRSPPLGKAKERKGPTRGLTVVLRTLSVLLGGANSSYATFTDCLEE
jgi:hypothetical protein